jgi:hypothetical protein
MRLGSEKESSAIPAIHSFEGHWGSSRDPEK